MCSKVLGDLGADVVKIEKPGGDPARTLGPFYGDIPDPEKSLYWFAFNMNKRGITLDIETADGREIFKRLVENAEIVVESFPPGYMDGLGLGYPALSEINPRIIVASITPFGQTGPYSGYKGSDIVAMAMAGMMYSTGEPDRAPVRISFPQAYLHAGVEAAVGSLAAYYHRQMTGQGQHVDVSIQATMVSATNNIQQYWAMNKILVQRAGPGRVSPVTGYVRRVIRQCKDGYMVNQLMGGPVGASTTRNLIKWLDEEGMAPDSAKQTVWEEFDLASMDPAEQRMIKSLNEALDRLFLMRTKEEILLEGVKRRIFMYPVCTAEDLAKNPQLRVRDFWEEVEHPELDATVTYPGAFFKTTEAPWRIRRRAPLIGEHNEDIYEKELGFSRKDLATLKQGGVI